MDWFYFWCDSCGVRGTGSGEGDARCFYCGGTSAVISEEEYNARIKQANLERRRKVEEASHLTEDDRVRKAQEAYENGNVSVRSCWHCNASHEHLKYRRLLSCFECEKVYYYGEEVDREKLFADQEVENENDEK